jgi:hypothetical protein
MQNKPDFLTEGKSQIFKDMDKKLLFTAVTRSYENLNISFSGHNIHPLFKNIPSNTYTYAHIINN